MHELAKLTQQQQMTLGRALEAGYTAETTAPYRQLEGHPVAERLIWKFEVSPGRMTHRCRRCPRWCSARPCGTSTCSWPSPRSRPILSGPARGMIGCGTTGGPARSRRCRPPPRCAGTRCPA
ncbi:hypothetical protein [Nonomuraea deserti]|uniref:hypothetical protein n=1 Tax=Nonomuraea deserti TaxID=1848322 RepID=UPI0034E0B164